MARYVKIGTVGATPPRTSAGGGSLIGQMRDHLSKQLDKVLPDGPDLILLPELCDRFADLPAVEQRRFEEDRGDALVRLMSRAAAEHRCHIAYPTMLRKEDGSFRNGMILLDRNGATAGTYHKMFPVLAEMEEGGVLAGRKPVVVDLDFGRVGCLLCFDLCFQELMGPYRDLAPDLMLFASMYHGGHVQQAWAYGTRSHFASAVQGLESAILSPLGETLARTTNYHDHVTATVNLDCRVLFLGLNKEKLRRAKVKYGGAVRVSDPGHLGAVLLSSESDERTADGIIREFDMEPIDAYFDSVRLVRQRHMEP